MDEKKPVRYEGSDEAKKLSEEQLSEVRGGWFMYDKDGHTYLFDGADPNTAFYCQWCKKPVRFVGGEDPQDYIFHCNACGEDYPITKLNRRQGIGNWRQIG